MSKWKEVKISELCSLITDGTHQTPIYSNDGYIFLSSKNVTTGKIDWYNVKYIPKILHEQLYKRITPKKDDILLAKNGTTGIAAKVDKDIIFDIYVSLALLRPKEIIDADYFVFAINNPFTKRKFDKQLKGIGVPNLHLNSIKETRIPLPPLEEQHKIASILDTVSETLKLRKQQLNEADLLVKSKFEEMFGNPVVNPKGFLCYTVDDVIEFQGGSQPDKKYFEYEKTEDNIRLIQIRDYKSNRYLTYIPKIMAKRFCTVDDIMIGRYGPPIFQILQGIEGSFNVALMKAIPRIGNKEFIRYFLKQDCLLKYLEGLSKRTAGQDGIQMDKLKLYPFPYPPIELQNKFASFVQHVDKLKSEVQKSIDQLQTLFDSLMQQYFE